MTLLAPVLLFVAAGIDATPMGECTIDPASPLELGQLQADAPGQANLTLEVSDLTPLLGIELYLQAAGITPGGPSLDAFELTNAVETASLCVASPSPSPPRRFTGLRLATKIGSIEEW